MADTPPMPQKAQDDYLAKIRFWAETRQVIPPGPIPKLPKFSKQTFSSHEEMNRWKENLLRQIAAERE